jgi:hypothetical protein
MMMHTVRSRKRRRASNSSVGLSLHGRSVAFDGPWLQHGHLAVSRALEDDERRWRKLCRALRFTLLLLRQTRRNFLLTLLILGLVALRASGFSRRQKLLFELFSFLPASLASKLTLLAFRFPLRPPLRRELRA